MYIKEKQIYPTERSYTKLATHHSFVSVSGIFIPESTQKHRQCVYTNHTLHLFVHTQPCKPTLSLELRVWIKINGWEIVIFKFTGIDNMQNGRGCREFGWNRCNKIVFDLRNYFLFSFTFFMFFRPYAGILRESSFLFAYDQIIINDT